MYFRSVFEFDAPSVITDIRYMDIYQRNLMDGVYAQWLRFTFDQATLERSLKARGLHLAEPDAACDELRDSVRPAWWPDVERSKIVLYVREIDGTKNGGTSSREFLWYDRASDYVYFHRRYWD